jgi:hypothetical protein
MSVGEAYLRLSEETNALDYLEKAVVFVRSASDNPIDWKWGILALHGAIYGFMICALKGTDPDRVLRNSKRSRWLIDFGEALKRCQDPAWMTMTCHSQVLKLSQEQEAALNYIHAIFRNGLVHYQPCLWSIEVSGLLPILAHGFDVVRFLSLETGNYTHLTREQCTRISQLVDQARAVLSNT